MNNKDIAQKACVSTATVSNVINGNHHKVNIEKKWDTVGDILFDMIKNKKIAVNKVLDVELVGRQSVKKLILLKKDLSYG